jgi:transposase
VGVFGDLYSKVSLQTLLKFPTSESILSTSESILVDEIASLCKSRSDKLAKERAKKLKDAFSDLLSIMQTLV